MYSGINAEYMGNQTGPILKMTTKPPIRPSSNMSSASRNSSKKGKVQIISIGRNEQPTFPKISNDPPTVYQVVAQEGEEVPRAGSRKSSFLPMVNSQPMKISGNSGNTADPEMVVASVYPEAPKTSVSQNDSIDLNKEETLGCCSKVMIGLNIFFILVALGYGVGGYFTAYDDKGLDVYFAGDTTEYDLISGLALKIANPSYEIKTDNWGYFQEADNRVSKDSSSKWKDYNVFWYILLFTGSTVLFSLGATSFSIYALRPGQESFATLVFACHALLLALFLGGNGYVWYKIYCFHSDFKDNFEACNCDSFESDYYTSIKLYFLSTLVMLAALVTQLIMSIVHRFSIAKKQDS
eukprot:TRINITY_DN775_c0_g1_i3.p2 TRINITY_DN775_c0_g1~~TRINITY_DN775_c0_g1_i3.p2  ORF type:complete len:352 (-),score=40.93 TRINITY_DN775_c0_g1_i3:61-1116(-)